MPDLTTPLGRARAHAYALVAEHAGINLVWRNLHRLSDRAYRSSQPTPGQLRRRIRRLGLRTVVCLRGFSEDSPISLLEREVCAKEGCALEVYKMHSRKIPSGAIIRGARDLLERIEYPALFHCKSGADRVGLFSTLYLHFEEGVPLAETRQLRFFPYGHVSGAKAGLLDHFFACYQAEHAAHGTPFLEWVDRMDPQELRDSFRPHPLWSLVFDKVLQRE